MSTKTGEIVESSNVTFHEKLPGGGALHLLPGCQPDDLYDDEYALEGHNPQMVTLPTFEQEEDVTPESFQTLTREPEEGKEEIGAHENDEIAPDDAMEEEEAENIVIPEQLEPYLVRELRPKRTTAGRKPSRFDDQFQYPRLYPRLSNARAASFVSSNAKRISYQEAKQDPLLQKAMLEELASIFKNGGAEIIDRPPGSKTITSTWMHKFKFEDGKFTRARSRWCPHGFKEIEGIHYDPDKITAPTPSFTSINLYFSRIVTRNMHELLVDVNGAFGLVGMKETVLAELPQGLENPPGQDKVLLLKNSFNGLKQSAYNWRERAENNLRKQGFKFNAIDPCYFWKYDGNDETCIILWVDDFRIGSTSSILLEDCFAKISAEFPVKRQSPEWYLGAKVLHNREQGWLDISMENRIDALLEGVGMSDCKPVSTPATPRSKLIRPPKDSFDEEAAKFPLLEITMSLLWIARYYRADILYAVNQITPHTSHYDMSHVRACKHLIRYIKGTKALTKRFHRAGGNILVDLEAFTDASYADEPEENEYPMRSLSGICIFVKGVGLIYAQSVLQKTIARNTGEAEYRAIGATAQHVIALRNQLAAMDLLEDGPTVIHEDNQAAIAMTKNVMSNANTRHIKLDHHYIRELVKDGEIALRYCATSDMVADILTKALDRQQFEKLRAILMGH